MRGSGDSLIALAVVFAPLSLLSFGGGNAVIADIAQQAIAVQGWTSEREFADLFALSRAAPGPGSMLAALIGWKAAGHSDESRPHPPMDKRDLALDEATHEDIIAVADRSRHREDLATLRMRPPATSNGFAGDDLSKRRARPVRGLQDDTALANESEGLVCSHRPG